MKLMAKKLRLKMARPRINRRSDGIRTISRRISRIRIKRPLMLRSLLLDFQVLRALTLRHQVVLALSLLL